MRKVCVITGSRAEYGLLYHTMKEIQNSTKLELQLIATGMHFSKAHGETYKIIENDGFNINYKLDFKLENSSGYDIAKAMGTATLGFAEAYNLLKPDIILVLGDRFEILCAVSAAIPYNIPIAHISGGEITQGAMDEQIRHAITKMAHIHFPGAIAYATNIETMAEEAWRIFNVGDPGIEVINRLDFIEEEKLFSELDININKRTILATLHPTTHNTVEEQINESKIFFDCLEELEDVNIIITYPNNDTNYNIIIDDINRLSSKQNIKIHKSLGNLRYLSLMKHCDLVVGNSSSALVEAPFLKVAAIDYGDRQKGRINASNIIHCDVNYEQLKKSIDYALNNQEFRDSLKDTISIYGEGNTSKEIVKALETIDINKGLLEKRFIANNKFGQML